MYAKPLMDRATFQSCFRQAAERAVSNAESRFGRHVGRRLQVRLAAFGADDTPLSYEAALDRLWLGDDRFFRIIDVAVTATHGEVSELWVRPSGHSPGAWTATWDPSYLGPFNNVWPEELKLLKKSERT